MAYDAKPVIDDVILNTFEERDRISVCLYLREGDDGQGADVFESQDDDCRQMFEDGFLERGPIGRLRDGDAKLLESAFAYALERRLGALATFESRVLSLVGAAEARLPAAYDLLDADKDAYPEDDDDREERLVENAVRAVMTSMRKEFGSLSDRRHDDVSDHLAAHLEGHLAEARPAAPAI